MNDYVVDVTVPDKPAAFIGVNQGPPGPQGPQGVPGTPGPASMAYSPMLPGHWWYANPFTAGSTYAFTLDQVVWQPFWSGAMSRIAGIGIGFSTAVDTTGNVCYFALYADSGCLPSALIAEFANLTTTTTIANAARAVACNQSVTPNTLYWLATLSKGGTAHPTVRTCTGGHPLVMAAISTALPTTSAGSPTSGYYYSATAFPDPAPANMNGTQVPPRIQVLAA